MQGATIKMHGATIRFICGSDIIVYFNINVKLLTKLINRAFVGE